MEQNKNTDIEVIDLRLVAQKLWKKRGLFVRVWIVTFILACLWILPQPRYYDTTVVLAPEIGGQNTGGGLASIASSFGVDIGSIQSEDAIYPTIYPDLFDSKDFIVGLFDIRVKTMDGEVDTTLYQYMHKYEKKNPVTRPFNLALGYIKNLFEDNKGAQGNANTVDPSRLTRRQEVICAKIKKNISCDVDIKTDIITIKVTAKDALVSATLADSVSSRLQQFITDYRTSKARRDLDYYQKLTDEAKASYDAATEAYSRYCDQHSNIILQAAISERDKLENEMSMCLSAYTAMNTQLQACKAKVQERTPAFTILQSASVPNKPAGPKRMIFVAAMLVLATIGCACYLFKKDIKELLLAK
ncbi:MAG: chain-length determining protein [Bacteroidaceae bacterium]|nr:chain-length determining protein [Bacteroidaceae bacterium]